MERLEKESSNIKFWDYEEKIKVLTVTFKNKSVYNYFDVPKEIHEGAKSAESIGKFLNTKVKGIFKYKKVN